MKTNGREKGQSLAEMALVLPLLLLLIVGVVEVSQLVITAQRVSTAARAAARFAANGGEAAGVRNVALNTVTQTMDLSPEYWDIWFINALVDDSGQIPAGNFTHEHIYGNGQTTVFTETNAAAAWDTLRQQIEDDLNRGEYGGAADAVGLEVDGVLIVRDVETMLGLNIIPNLVGMNAVRGFTVMRHNSTTVIEETSGCRGVFPLALEENVRTITRAEYEALSFEYPGSAPRWEEFVNQPQQGSTASLAEGREGYVYKFTVGTGPQQMGLLQWNPGGGSLATSMTWPGNSESYSEPGDPTDTTINTGDFVARSGEGLNAAKAQLQQHINQERTLRGIGWDFSTGGFDAVGNRFRIGRFVVVRAIGYGSDWVLLEIYRLDDSCGKQS